MVEGDDVGLGAVRAGSNGGPGEIGQCGCIRQRHASPWREGVHGNRVPRCDRHDTVESGTTEITIDGGRQIGGIGGNRAGHLEV